MSKTDKLSINIDFKWIFMGDSKLREDVPRETVGHDSVGCETVLCEDNQKYRTFLKEMYISGTSPSLLLKKEEIEFLEKYK